MIVSSQLHACISRTDRGEPVNAASHTLELFPALHGVRVLRQWAGLCDMTPDFSPIMDTPDLLTPFRLSRFAEGCLVGGKAAAVSHEPSLFT